MKIRTLGKKALALTVCLAVLLSCLIISGISASAVTVWDGTTKQPVDSDSDGVFEIGTAAELAWVAQHDTSDKYILTADIYVNDLKVNVTSSGATLTKLDGSAVDTTALKTWIATGPFCGTLDGNGYTVNGLYNATEDAAAGYEGNRALLAHAYNATVKNLRVVNTYFHGGTYGGTIFSYANAGSMNTVDNCYIENVSITSHLGGNGQSYPAVGGVMGYTQNSGLTVNNTAVVNAYLNYPNCQRRGAILGDAWAAGNVTITNTYTVADYAPFGNGTSSTGNFTGTNTASNFYTTTPSTGNVAPQSATTSKELLQGKNPLVAAYGLGDNFYTTAGYPMQEIFLDSIDANVNKQLGTAPFDGSGTEDDPYLIKTADDLRNAIGTYGMGKYYKLANDIVLNDVDKIDWATGVVADGYDANVWFVSDLYTGQEYNGFAGRGAFTGTLDGDGYAVHGLYIPFSVLSTSSGLVPVTSNATIKNIAIKNSFMAGGHWTGGITGYSYANTTFDTVLVDETVTVVGYDVGNKYFIDGWVKQDNPDAAASPFMGTVSGGVGYESECAGGIVGYINGTGAVNNCAVYGTVRGIADSEKFTTTNPLTNGGETVVVGPGSHINAIVGTGWNSTITITNNVSLIQPHDNISGNNDKDGNPLYTTTCENNYAQAIQDGKTCCNVLEDSQMTGANALTNMPGLSPDVWTKTAGYPLQKIFTCLGANHADEHVWTDWAETTPPECEQPGEETRECSVCGAPDSRHVTETGHDPASDWTKDETHHWHVCGNNCGEKLDNAQHTFDQMVETSYYSAGSADCTQPAKFYFSCVCGAKGTQTFDSGTSMGHSPKNEWTSDASGHWHECNNCTEKLDYAAHNYNQEVVDDDYLDTPADCNNPAKYVKSCECGAKGTEYFESGNANGHDPKTEWTSDANGHWHECNNCTEKLDYAAHNYDQEVVDDDYLDTPADCNNPAKYVKSCVCGAEGTDTFESGNANGHDPKTEWNKDATHHWHDCDGCDEKLDKAEHNYDQEVAKDAYLAEGATSAAAAKYYKTCECGAKGTETFSYGDPLNPGGQGGGTPETGDTSNVMVWVITLILSAGALTLLAVYSRKRTN